MSAPQAAPAPVGPSPMTGLLRSLSVDLSAPRTMPTQKFTAEEKRILLAALEAYDAKLAAPSDTVSWQMRQHLMQKLQTGSMSTKPKKPRTRRGPHGPSKLSQRSNAKKTRKHSSNSNKKSANAFPRLNSVSGNENAEEMRF